MSDIMGTESGYISRYNCKYYENFDIDKIKIGKYEVRKVTRTPESIQKLADDIIRRGQVESVHIAIIEGDYHLIAGYTRYYALKKIGRSTIRALVYENLTHSDIYAFVTGTNEFRINPCAWEKMRICVQYYYNVPDTPIYNDIESNEKSLADIFGLGRSSVYQYLAIYNFISSKKTLLSFVENNPNVSINSLIAINAERKYIKSPKDEQIVVECIKSNLTGQANVQRSNIRKLFTQDLKPFEKSQVYDAINLSTPEPKSFEKTIWKNAEMVLEDTLNNINGVMKVSNLSNQKLGYDFEIIFTNGDKYFVDCKKVSSVDEPFTLTNLQVAVAQKEKVNYIIALVIIKSDGYEIKYIQDPMNKIKLEPIQTVTQWRSDNHYKVISDKIVFNQ